MPGPGGFDLETEMLTTAGWVRVAELEAGAELVHPGGHAVVVTALSDPLEVPTLMVRSVDQRQVTVAAGQTFRVTDKRRERSVGPAGGPRRRWCEERTITAAMVHSEGTSRYNEGKLHRSVTDGKEYATKEYRFQTPQQEPIKALPQVDLPVDPYLFGAWLGDGTSANGSMTCAACRPRSRRLGVLHNKHVPDLYLAASAEQREALLQGLIDTDGHVDKRRGQIEFCAMNQRLATATLFLARSLGWRATLNTGRATLNGIDCGTKYRVTFTPKRCDPFTPCRMPRKLEQLRPTDGGKGRFTLSIVSVEPIGQRFVRSITVDSPDGQFLAGRDLMPVGGA